MLRHLRLLLIFIKQSLQKQLAYRMDFMISAFVTFLWSGLRIVFYKFSFGFVGTIGDWNFGRAMILTGVFLSVMSIYKIFFEESFNEFVHTIYNGNLDFILLKPVNSQIMISLRYIKLHGISRLLVGIFVFIWGARLEGLHITFAHWLIFILMMLVGVIIYYSIYFISLCSVFYLGYIRNINFLFRPILSMLFIPFDTILGGINALISWIFPIVFVATVPARVLFDVNPLQILQGLFLGILLLFLGNLIWKQSLKNYASLNS